MREFLLRVAVLPWDRDAAASYGTVRAALERNGRGLGALDLGALDMLIAAHALAADAVLVTNDAAFARVEGLRCADWTVRGAVGGSANLP